MLDITKDLLSEGVLPDFLVEQLRERGVSSTIAQPIVDLVRRGQVHVENENAESARGSASATEPPSSADPKG
jgi:hypothetical protein